MAVPLPEDHDRGLDLYREASHLEGGHVLVLPEEADEALVALGMLGVGIPANEAPIGGHPGRLDYDFIIAPAALWDELTVTVV